jgi:putative oxidoreductase
MNPTILPQSWTPTLLAALRVMTGLAFLEHGTGKILDFPVLQGLDDMPGVMVTGTGLLELVGGVLIVIGLMTRPAAFILSGYMAVAFFMVHFPLSFFPALNHGEAALLYCFVFLFLAAAGPGPWSLDEILAGAGAAPGRGDLRGLDAKG